MTSFLHSRGIEITTAIVLFIFVSFNIFVEVLASPSLPSPPFSLSSLSEQNTVYKCSLCFCNQFKISPAWMKRRRLYFESPLTTFFILHLF